MTSSTSRCRRKERERNTGEDRLPAGVQLPSGRVLTYPASRDCGCETCIRAFEAYRAGELRLPEEDGLPW